MFFSREIVNPSVIYLKDMTFDGTSGFLFSPWDIYLETSLRVQIRIGKSHIMHLNGMISPKEEHGTPIVSSLGLVGGTIYMLMCQHSFLFVFAH